MAIALEVGTVCLLLMGFQCDIALRLRHILDMKTEFYFIRVQTHVQTRSTITLAIKNKCVRSNKLFCWRINMQCEGVSQFGSQH